MIQFWADLLDDLAAGKPLATRYCTEFATAEGDEMRVAGAGSLAGTLRILIRQESQVCKKSAWILDFLGWRKKRCRQKYRQTSMHGSV
jgi:hypothetical protein